MTAYSVIVSFSQHPLCIVSADSMLEAKAAFALSFAGLEPSMGDLPDVAFIKHSTNGSGGHRGCWYLDAKP